MPQTFADNKTPDGMNFNPKPDISKQHDMPLGLGMSLSMNNEALDYYCSLDDKIRQMVIQNVVCCETGEEAKKKIKTAVNSLAKHDLSFLG